MKEWWAENDAQRIERWEQCIRVLKGLDAHTRSKHWSMEIFLVATPCGMIGCAAGHCFLDPWFQAQGLHPETNGHYYYLYDWNGKETDDPLAHFFDRYGSENIFHNLTPRSVETVIAEVEQHIAWLKGEGPPVQPVKDE